MTPSSFGAVMQKALEETPPLASLVDMLGAERRELAVRGFADHSRRQARELHEGGASGTEVVGIWSRLIDHLVSALYHSLCGQLGLRNDGIALLALGGYGRGELSPYSDLDLLVLHANGDKIASLVEGFLYPLWDAGLDVQCVARTIEENLAITRADIRSRTSLLEARYLAGDANMVAEYDERVLREEIFGQKVRWFMEAKLAEMEERHHKYGDTVYVLEPNLKEGEGGLRDIQTAIWLAKVRFKVRSVPELLHKGVIPPAELEALDASRRFLLRLRNHLHFLTGRREDRLSFEYQDEVAPFFGFHDSEGIPSAEHLLQSFFDTANRVGHFTQAVIQRAILGVLPGAPDSRQPPREVARGVRLQAGVIYVDPQEVRKHRLTLLSAFETAQIHGASLSPQALEVVRDHLELVDDRFRRDPEAVNMFLKILSHPRRVATTLMRMHDVRFLDRFIPEFGRIFGRIQRDLYHIYPVDVHSLFAVQELRRLARGEYEQQFPVLTSLIRDLERPDILYLATLLHDVGKGEGHGHEERGAEIALAVGDRMGLEPRDLEYLVFLVRNHLILSHTAQGRDLHDEELIGGFARKVGEPELLNMLYLLTFADIRAVGPGAWTNWKDLLIRELWEKALHVMERGGPAVALAEERVREVRERVRRAVTDDISPDDVEAFLNQIDHPQYLLANPLEALLRHLRAFCKRTQEPVVELRPVRDEGYTEVLLVTRDRPGLFAKVAGLMAAHQLNILSAALNTRPDGWVLDVFHVSGPPGETLGGTEQWERWRTDLVRVLTGSVTLEGAVGTKLQRRRGLRRPRPPAPIRVRVDNSASRRFTVIDVRAADRLGLLYDVAKTLAEQGLTIHLAKIVTNIDQVADSFYVQPVGGGKLTDPSEIARLEAALEWVLGEEGLGREAP